MKQFTRVFSILIFLILLLGCKQHGKPVQFNESKTILYAEFMQEVNVMTPGLSNINVDELHYQYISRPIYPLDELENWR